LIVNDLGASDIKIYDLDEQVFVRSLKISPGSESVVPMSYPNWSILLDNQRLLVSDSNNNRLLVFDIETGQFAGWGTEVLLPRGLAMDAAGMVHVVSPLSQSVSVFTPQGIEVGSYSMFTRGSAFQIPVGITSSTDHLFISDQAAGVVHVGGKQ
jgi:sugar lactone lactonase YvrE